MGRIVRRVQINGNAPYLLLAPFVSGDHRVRQCFGQAQQVTGPSRVLEPRQRRLRRQRPICDRVTAGHKFHNRIVGQSRGVVTVGIAAGDAEKALLKQLLARVRDLRLLAIVRQTRSQRCAQFKLLVARLEQHRSTVGTGVILVEFDGNRLPGQILEQNTLFGGIVCHAKALSAGKWLLANTILAYLRAFVLSVQE